MLNVYGAMNMSRRVGRAPYPGMTTPYMAPSYGYAYGGSMFAYGAIARMTRRVAYHESRMHGYWGNNPAHYYINAMGAHARSIAVPGGMAGAQQAGTEAAPDAAQRAQAAQKAGARATGSTEGGGEAGETAADKRARAKREAEEAKKKEKKERVEQAVKNARAQAKTHLKSLGYGSDEIAHVVDAIESTVKNDPDAKGSAQALGAKFEKILKAVPPKETTERDRRTGKEITKKNPQWSFQFGKFWAQYIKGTNLDRAKAIAERAVSKRMPKGRRPLAYMKVENRGFEKVNGKEYEVFGVVDDSVVGRRAQAYRGRTLYKRGKRWYRMGPRGRMRRIPSRRWTLDRSTGELSLNGKNWKYVPKPGMNNAIQVGNAIDAHLKKRGEGRAKTAQQAATDIAKLIGNRNGAPLVRVEHEGDGRVHIRAATGDSARETGRMAYAIQQRIASQRARFNRIVGKLGGRGSLKLDGHSIPTTAAADAVIERLAKKAVRVTPSVDVRRIVDGKDVKPDEQTLKKRVSAFIKDKGIRAEELKNVSRFVIRIRVAKGHAPSKNTVEAVREGLQRFLADKGVTDCKVAIEPQEVPVVIDKRDPKQVAKLRSIMKAAVNDFDGTKERLHVAMDRALKGSNDPDNPGFPYSTQEAIRIAYKALYKTALRKRGKLMEAMRRGDDDLELAKAEYRVWYEGATSHLEEHVGKESAAEFAIGAVTRMAKKPAASRTPPTAGNGGGRVRRGGLSGPPTPSTD